MFVGVSVGVFVGITGVFVGVSVGVFVGITGVLVGVSVGVFVGITGVLVGVSVGVFVGITGVLVGVFVGVLVGVSVGVLVGVNVGVFVGVMVGKKGGPLYPRRADSAWSNAISATVAAPTASSAPLSNKRRDAFTPLDGEESSRGSDMGSSSMKAGTNDRTSTVVFGSVFDADLERLTLLGHPRGNTN